MVADAIAHCFDEDGFAAAFEKSAFSRCECGGPNGEDIVAVDADRVDAVADTAGGDPVATVLLKGRCGDGVSVVAADEDDGTAAGSSNVEGSVEVAF